MLKIRKLMVEQYGESKISFFVYSFLRLIIIAIIVMTILRQNFEAAMNAAMALVFFFLPPFFERVLKADFPSLFECIILFFVFSANILGEVFAFYIKFAWWDTMLHTVYGFLFAAFAFSLVDILNSEGSEFKFKLSPFYMCLNSVGFTVLIGVIWEFFEFSMDYFFGKDMQKDTYITSFNTVLLDETNSNVAITIDNIKSVIIDSYGVLPAYIDIGLYDTMKDLFVAFLGAVIFCIFLVPYLKSHGQNKLVASLIPVKRNWKENPPKLEVEFEKLKQEKEEKEEFTEG